MLPPLDRAARLPFALAVLLLILLLYQVQAGSEVIPLEAGPIGSGPRQPSPAAIEAPVSTPAVILARSIFATAGKPTPASAEDQPLAGVTIAGSIRSGERQLAVVQGPGAVTRIVATGGRIGDWTLVGLRPDGAVLRRGGRQITLPFGARTASAAPPQRSS
ncbi:hypothetical protein [Sphingomonas sp. 8AM]|uniref:hypothetical protein n=1 Tax=Sphingomonas sp. 8AM TaxID=2653170 RepID=UPI0012F25F07|nr:hypothetical protein [Sphingomonas sp. 8AM]VXD01456.1 conserved hypothetical protein [Sphingomonas sp. 8AM]